MNAQATARPPQAGPVCPYCGKPSIIALQRGRPLWMCRPCQAWVGVHDPNTLRPLGTLANAELRRLRNQAHANFDPLWKAKWIKTRCRKAKARGLGYRWLAQQMGIKSAACHIGMFDAAQCREVLKICGPYVNAARTVLRQNNQTKTPKS